METQRKITSAEGVLALLASGVAVALVAAFGGGIVKVESEKLANGTNAANSRRAPVAENMQSAPPSDAAGAAASSSASRGAVRPMPKGGVPAPLAATAAIASADSSTAVASSASPPVRGAAKLLPLNAVFEDGQLRLVRPLWADAALFPDAPVFPLFDIAMPRSTYVPIYFDSAPGMSWQHHPAAAGRLLSAGNSPPPEGILAPGETAPHSPWDVGVRTDSSFSHDDTSATRTTLTPVVLSLQRSLQLRGMESFRPLVSLGAGMLRQTVEDTDSGNIQDEYIPLLRAGLGAEWHPSAQLQFHLRYEYSHLTRKSVLNPALAGREHSLQTGVELKF